MTTTAAEFTARYGPWALVAGASEGLGEAFAQAIAASGVNVVLVARRPEVLQASAQRIRDTHGVQARAIAADLADPSTPARLLADLADVEVGLLVYNAALSVSGPVLDVPLETHLRALQVNCASPLALVHGLGRAMRDRRRGGIVLVSSLSGVVGSACLATYSGTKAFNNVFGEALWDELRGDGVDAVVSWAGAVATPGYAARRPEQLPALAPKPLAPETVARDALAALPKPTPRTIPGGGNRFASFALNHLMSRKKAVTTMGTAGREVHRATVARAALPAPPTKEST